MQAVCVCVSATQKQANPTGSELRSTDGRDVARGSGNSNDNDGDGNRSNNARQGQATRGPTIECASMATVRGGGDFQYTHKRRVVFCSYMFLFNSLLLHPLRLITSGGDDDGDRSCNDDDGGFCCQ